VQHRQPRDSPGEGDVEALQPARFRGRDPARFHDDDVVEPARIAAQARGLHRLYVALTRAVSRLTVLHTEPLPGPLG